MNLLHVCFAVLGVQRLWAVRPNKFQKQLVSVAGDPPGEQKGLGLLLLEYAYPTQPGDIDDKRSFCVVDSKYECQDGFTIIPAQIKGLTFENAQANKWEGTPIPENMKGALEKLLLDPRVVAITCNCGFFGFYKDRLLSLMAELSKKHNVPRKPIKAGTLSLLPLILKNLGDKEDVVVATANKASLDAGLRGEGGLLGKLGIKPPPGAVDADDVNSQEYILEQVYKQLNGDKSKIEKEMTKIISVGTLYTPGFGQEVARGENHQITVATPHFTKEITDHMEGANVGLVLLECTEMPAYSNAIRAATKKPVWDINLLAMCLVKTAPVMAAKPTIADVTDTPEFLQCMRDLEKKIDSRYGYQQVQEGDHPFAVYKGWKTPSGWVPQGSPETGTVRALKDYRTEANR